MKCHNSRFYVILYYISAFESLKPQISVMLYFFSLLLHYPTHTVELILKRIAVPNQHRLTIKGLDLTMETLNYYFTTEEIEKVQRNLRTIIRGKDMGLHLHILGFMFDVSTITQQITYPKYF